MLHYLTFVSCLSKLKVERNNFFKIGKSTLYKMAREGKIPAVKIKGDKT